MVMWTVVWCPNRLSHKEPHCLHNIVRKTEVSELHARIMFLIGWSTEMERDL
jgi:formyltetrahydrofolate hydrolase